MKFPHRVRDRSVQSNFDYLSTVFGSYRLSQLQTNSAYSMGVGVTAFVVDKSGFTVVQGIIVIEINPSAHFNFTWYPRPTIPDIVFNNTGVLQSTGISYIVVGR